ncbi:hypothetical protein SNE40_014360 [Patella caerulea]|uniref:Uncharacterized protein n=1 Tax=Patella caerulea TaxID=87958 RepID=A0AAN8JGS8_PATCE
MHRLSNLVNIILKPLCKHVKSFLRDGIDFLSKLSKTMIPGSTLVSCDIVNLYSNIDSKLGHMAMEHWVNKHRDEIPGRFTTKFIFEALDLVITINIFYSDANYYSQIKGVAMGTKVAPTYATLSLGYLEVLFIMM